MFENVQFFSHFKISKSAIMTQKFFLEKYQYGYEITINVPLFKKLRDIIFFLRDNNFWAVSRDILRGPRLFWPLKLSRAQRGTIRGQKSRGPLKMSREMAHKVIVPKKKIMSQSFLNLII